VFDYALGTLTTVQLSLSGIRLPFGLVDTVFEDLVAQSLHRVLTYVSISLLLITATTTTFMYGKK